MAHTGFRSENFEIFWISKIRIQKISKFSDLRPVWAMSRVFNRMHENSTSDMELEAVFLTRKSIFGRDCFYTQTQTEPIGADRSPSGRRT